MLCMPTYNQYFDNNDQLKVTQNDLDLQYRKYVKALMEKDKDKTFYPDANLTCASPMDK